MRLHKANEPAITKTMAFLEDIRNEIQHGHKIVFSNFYAQYQLSKVTGVSCQDLGIINPLGKGLFEWGGKEINRHLALLVMDANLHRNKKSLDVPILPDMATTNSLLEKILENTSTNADFLKSAVKRLISLNEIKVDHNQKQLFTDIDQKRRDIIYISGKISIGMYSKQSHVLNDTDDIELINKNIITCAIDLLNQINKINYAEM